MWSLVCKECYVTGPGQIYGIQLNPHENNVQNVKVPSLYMSTFLYSKPVLHGCVSILELDLLFYDVISLLCST